MYNVYIYKSMAISGTKKMEVPTIYNWRYSH